MCLALLTLIYRDHYRQIHGKSQCQRCWKVIWDSEEYSLHMAFILKGQPQCADLTHQVERKSMVTSEELIKISQALETERRSKAKPEPVKKTEEQTWFDVGEIIFPPKVYPYFRPIHPCKFTAPYANDIEANCS
jgi:hypothetical protein